MRDTTDLPLFTWSEPVKTIPFPCNKRIGKARTVASTFLGRKTEQTRQKYWDQTVQSMGRQMRKAGIAQEIIDRELEAFAVLVSREVERQQGGSTSEGGAIA